MTTVSGEHSLMKAQKSSLANQNDLDPTNRAVDRYAQNSQSARLDLQDTNIAVHADGIAEAPRSTNFSDEEIERTNRVVNRTSAADAPQTMRANSGDTAARTIEKGIHSQDAHAGKADKDPLGLQDPGSTPHNL